MSSASKIMYQFLKERHAKYVADFVNAEPGTVDDSLEVLQARLFGLGFRRSELQAEMQLAVAAKKEKQTK